ncbi:nitroreductase/quinone reductase family protein [Micromonospora sp. C95]|uniref:nitroreductase/quinone reductase family protein n=1 Tax=Micromonospora sp. C95 TaxID=2824882 RepID=UPI001B367939|nr:nitroreductase/quinone reductase family protein [Micromonospora sp. C95]MBQ1027463.1 nitroreductase family deazaflavin-dependent oxidoreductase [Micromonospora sp. C95]
MTNAIGDALDGVQEVELTVTGRRSGRQITHPVWFVQEDDNVFLVPVTGSDSQWYKNVQQTPMVQLAVDGTSLSSSATPITEADQVDHVVAMFRDKYGADQIASFYPKHDVAVQVPLG